MRWFAALLVCILLRSARFEGSIYGFWVLNQRLSRFTSPAIPERVVMEVDSTARGWVSVYEIRTDAGGQRLQSDEYAIHPADAMPAAKKNAAATTCFLLLSQATGIIEEWTMAPGGLLLIQRPLPTALGTEHERLVFQRAERRGLEVVK